MKSLSVSQKKRLKKAIIENGFSFASPEKIIKVCEGKGLLVGAYHAFCHPVDPRRFYLIPRVKTLKDLLILAESSRPDRSLSDSVSVPSSPRDIFDIRRGPDDGRKKKLVTLRLDLEDYEKMQMLAKNGNVPVSSLIRESMLRYLE